MATSAGSSAIDWGVTAKSVGASAAQSAASGMARGSASRAVRITIDHAGVYSRTMRVYYSPDASFSNLVEVITVQVPTALQSAASVTVGFGGVSVSSACSCASGLQLLFSFAVRGPPCRRAQTRHLY